MLRTLLFGHKVAMEAKRGWDGNELFTWQLLWWFRWAW